MKYFLYDLLINPFINGELYDKIMSVVSWLILLATLFGVLYLMVYLVDSIGLDRKLANGIVTEKIFTPAHTTVQYVHVNKSTIPQTVYHDDEWKLKIEVMGKFDAVTVSKVTYAMLKIGDKINCSYVNGRLTNTLYIKSVLVEDFNTLVK